MFGYRVADSEQLKEAKRRHYRAECRLRCLTSALDRTDPKDFDELMDQIEIAQAEIQEAAQRVYRLSWAETAEDAQPSAR